MNISATDKKSMKIRRSQLLPSTDSVAYFHDKDEFPNFYNRLHQAGNEQNTISFLEVYFEKYPLLRPLLIQLYYQLMNNTGQAQLAKEICRIYSEVSELLLNIGQSKLGVPPIFESQYYSHGTRSLASEAAYTHHLTQLGELSTKPVFCLQMHKALHKRKEELEFINSFLPYLDDVFEVVTDENKSRQYFEMRNVAPFNSTFYARSNNIFGHTNNFFGVMYHELLAANLNPWAFKLKGITGDTALKFLKDLGLKKRDEFVVIHFRENVENDSFHNKYLNHNPLNYIDAIDWLLSIGLKVVRIGNANMTPLPEKKGLIDLTRVTCPGHVSIYLCAAAKFYFGSLSGSADLCTHFGTRLLLTDLNFYKFYQPRSLVQLLPFFNSETNRIISKTEIEHLNLGSITSVQPFDRVGLKPRFGKNSKHLRSVKEMVEKIENGSYAEKILFKNVQASQSPSIQEYTADVEELL